MLPAHPSSESADAPLVVTGVSKRYGSVQALDRVDAVFSPGEIHAVLGENGAGKSTLMAVLSGFVVPDQGSVLLNGASIPLGDPMGCRARGIELVHQHFTLVPEFTVAENLALAAQQRPTLALNVTRSSASAIQVAERLGWEVPANAKVDGLPVGTQQRIEILKALSSDAPVLILDEPTAVLAPHEVQDLFRVMRELRIQGKTILLIAHKLSEVFQVADRVTVLRRGKLIATSLLSETDPATVAEWMVGAAPEITPPVERHESPGGFRLTGVCARSDVGIQAVDHVDLELPHGVIVGIGGVDGNGQTELAEAVVGIRPLSGGSLSYNPQTLSVGYIPQDRQMDGLALEMSIQDNLLIRGIRKPSLTRYGLLRLPEIARWTKGLVDRFAIKIGETTDPARSLSGGNQQKVIVARTLESSVDLLVAVNPTRGLDLKATQFVHEQIRAAAAGGASVLLISTDLDELAALSERTVFLNRGKIVEGDLAAALLTAGGSA